MQQPSLIARILHLLGSVLKPVLGTIVWQPPGWLLAFKKIGPGLSRNPIITTLLSSVLLALLVAGWSGYRWISHHAPSPAVSYRLTPPALTDYQQSPKVVHPVSIRFAQSVAPLEQIGKIVVTGIQLSPTLPGHWRWQDDRTLTFLPSKDWPVHTHFLVRLRPHTLLAGGLSVQAKQTSFQTAAFTARIKELHLYENPTKAMEKKIIGTLAFSHPVDQASLEEVIRLQLARGGQFNQTAHRPWQLLVEKNGLLAHLTSAPIALADERLQCSLTLAPGIRAQAGGTATAKPLKASVTIPGRYHLIFHNFSVDYIKDATGKNQQILLITSSFPLASSQLAKHTKAWLLPPPAKGERLKKPTPERLRQARLLPLTPLTTATPLSKLHSFPLQVPGKSRLYIQIDNALVTPGGYRCPTPTDELLTVRSYPKVLRFLGEGALLSLDGDKQVGFMAQGIDQVKVEVAQLLPGQLHQLVDTNTGRFAQPSLTNRLFDRIVEKETFLLPLRGDDPAVPQYEAIHLGPFLSARGGRHGLFVLRLTPFDTEHPKRSYPDQAQSADQGDRRLILVTDFGIISKQTLDKSWEVYVQSIASGRPCKGVRVQMVGRNGMAVATKTTDEEGHVRFPQLADLTREKQPIMLVATKGRDLSFLPLHPPEHRLNFSRFDIGGRYESRGGKQLDAYLFTDRGLYRPGETVHLGSILRTKDWQRSTTGMPLQIEVRNPRGTISWSRQLVCSKEGLDSVDIPLSADDPTGSYSAALSLVDSQQRKTYLGSAPFDVQEFEPDRMKVSLHLGPAKQSGWIRPAEIKPWIKARHLFGADAANRRVEGALWLRPAQPAFRQYPQYRFNKGKTLDYALDEEIAASKTDPQGKAQLHINLTSYQHATYKLHLTAKVFEAEGGRYVADAKEILVSDAPYLVGVKTDDNLRYVPKDAKRTSHWLAVGPDLQPLEAGNLQLRLLEYHYVSVLVRGNNGTYQYESRRQQTIKSQHTVNLGLKGLNLPLPTDEPGDFAYELSAPSGRLLNQQRWTVAGVGNLSRSLERNAELQLSLNKKSYQPGETIQLNLRAPFTGSGLITIERDRVYAHRWFHSQTTSSVQEITIPQELEGNGYVTVQFVRSPNSPEIYTSPLSSGVAAFTVSLAKRQLPLSLAAPKVVQPGQLLKLRCQAGQTARAVVFGVDEGILQVADYQAPAPLQHFFAKRALQVETSQILRLILPEFRQFLQANAPGGGADEAKRTHLNPFGRKKRPPVAFWSGILTLPTNGQEITYQVPETFNGRIRLMAVAATEARIGVATAATEVRGPWILTPNLPSFVAPGDTFTVTLGVLNNQHTNDQLHSFLDPGPGLQILSAPPKTITIAKQQEKVLHYQLKAGNTPMPCQLQFTAQSTGGRAKNTESLTIRPASPSRVTLRTGLFSGKEFSLQPSRSLYPQYRKETVVWGGSPLVWMQGLTAYLASYPYSCTEQLLSKAIPALVNSPPQSATQFQAAQSAFTLLRQRRNPAGGFSLWTNNWQVQPEISVYACDFLEEARAHQIAIPPDLAQHARRYLEQIAQNGTNEDLPALRNRARAIYLLTRQGVITSRWLAATMEQLIRFHEPDWKKDLTAAYLGASFVLLQQSEKGTHLIEAVPWLTMQPPGLRSTQDILSHDAELLHLLTRHFPHKTTPPQLLERLGRTITANQYHSLSAALLIRALSQYKLQNAQIGDKIMPSVLVAEGRWQPLPAQASTAHPLPFDWQQVVLKRKNRSQPVFYLVREQGFDRPPLPAAQTKGIEISRTLYDTKGQVLQQPTVGQECTVELRLRTTSQETSQVAVVDLLPGGLEPVLDRPRQGEERIRAQSQTASADPAQVARELWEPEYVETREDRVILYAHLGPRAVRYTYTVRAVNAGTFQLPPPYAEAMYNRQLWGRGKGGLLTIVPPAAVKQ